MGANSKIKTCTCIHKDQDKWYGKQKRIHNKLQGPKERSEFPKYRCSVCKNVKNG